MPRLALVCVFAVVVAVSVHAQDAVEYAPAKGRGPSLRVLDSGSDVVTVELTADWREPLAESVARSGGLAAVLVAQSGGRNVLSHEIGLASSVPPAVTVVAFEGEEVVLTASQGEAFAGLQGSAAEVVGIGERRRELVGSLALRALRVEGNRLIRATRLVAQVRRPPVVARLAARVADNPHLAVTRSVLADGTWYKVPIRKSGVYRIDAAFLRDSLGIEGSVSLSSVGVYGTGGRILPALNSAPRPADLLPVPAFAFGDALLFYAEGPEWWDWSPSKQQWIHDISPFSEASYYFIRVDAPAPARLGSGTYPGWGDATAVSRIEDRRYYEIDRLNYPRDGSGSGLDWLGPGLTTSGSPIHLLDEGVAGATASDPVVYRARVAARANPSVSFALSKGGQTLATGRPPAVSFAATNEGNLINDAFIEATTTFGSGLAVDLRATGGNTGAEAWLDWIEAVVMRSAAASPNGVIRFPTPGGQSGRFQFRLTGFTSEPQVWDVTTPESIRRVGVRAEGSGYQIQAEVVDSGRARELIAFDPAGAAVRTPDSGIRVVNQNLHGLTETPDYVILVHPDFKAQAERLAAYRQQDGLRTLVVTTDQVDNEFGGGTIDMRAPRDFLKFLYDRAPADRLPRYFLLFGDGHYDYRNIDINTPVFVQVYETENMFNKSDSYTSDDYYGLLGDGEGVWALGSGSTERVDLGVGRLPVRTVREATAAVDKIFRYESPATRGEWRTRFTFIADDQYPNTWDTDLHVLNADYTADLAESLDPTVTLQKIYGPSYPDVVTASGRRRPQATEAIRQGIEEGTLVWNYSGHGGPLGLGDEEYLTPELVASLDNADRLPIFVTATCSFGKFDGADQSLAERVLLRSGGGGIAMFTTVRLVYTSTSPDSDNNFGLNVELTEQMLVRDAEGRPSRLGDILYRTKNTGVGAGNNNRKFNLLGDPAMRIGMGERSISVEAPSLLQAFEEATISGQVLGLNGQPAPAYRGEIQVTVYDAARKVTMPETVRPYTPCCHTDDDDDDDNLGDYVVRSDIIYSGRATVREGRFSTTFLVPQDISYSGLSARVEAYVLGEDGSDGVGVTTDAIVSTESGTRPNDLQGPQISLFLNDSTFVDGGTTGPEGVLIARLSDASGINTVGAGVGHELLLVLDGDEANAIDVGRFYEGDLDTYRSGVLRVPLPELAPGEHTATLTAFDALNNSATASLRFVVVDEGLVVRSVLPYPNPTAGPARFFVEHNQSIGTAARVQLRIYTLAGRPIRTIEGHEALPDGVLSSRVLQIAWDGLDDDLDRLGSGVYLVRLRMETDDPAGGTRVAERVERLAIIR